MSDAPPHPTLTRAAVEQAVGGTVHVASEAAAAVDAVMAIPGDDRAARALKLLDGISWRHMSAANRRAVTGSRRVLRQAVADGGDPAPTARPVPRNGGPGRQWSPLEQRVLDALHGDVDQATELVALLGEEDALAVALEHGDKLAATEYVRVQEPPC